jgi:TetR/AcrR family fatty acid metabolism transcriptional regulator
MRTLQEQKRREILGAAAAVFAAKGFHQALMDDVAARAGIGKGTIYRYFAGKEDLFFSILDAEVDDLRARLEHAAASRQSPDRALRAMIATLADFTLRNRPLMQLLPEIGQDEIRKRVKRIHRQNTALVNLVEREIRRGIDDGLFRAGDARTWARMISLMTRAAFGHGKPVARGRALRTLLDLFLHGIASRR